MFVHGESYLLLHTNARTISFYYTRRIEMKDKNLITTHCHSFVSVHVHNHNEQNTNIKLSSLKYAQGLL